MSRPAPEEVKRVSCIGAGTIGGGWAAYFLAHGMDVIATDPAPDGEERLRGIVDQAWPSLKKLGLAKGARRSRLRFVPSVEEAVAETDFIQESAPDHEDLKIELFQRIDAAAPKDVVIASSSSQFLPTRIASRCGQPERCIVGHPFAPSYLLPLVEVVGGERTTNDVLDWAMSFYNGIGKVALRLKKEIESYVSNRLQRVISQEINSLVEAGICDYRDADVALVYGPGLRWAFAGPLLCSNMGGGKGGIRGAIKHWGWRGPPQLESFAVRESDAQSGHLDMDEIEAWRDKNLLLLLKGLKPLP